MDLRITKIYMRIAKILTEELQSIDLQRLSRENYKDWPENCEEKEV